jgi:methionyl-tRNA formyltransferase
VLSGKVIKIHSAEIAEYTENRGISPGTIKSIDSKGIVVSCGKGAIRITELQVGCGFHRW